MFVKKNLRKMMVDRKWKNIEDIPDMEMFVAEDRMGKTVHAYYKLIPNINNKKITEYLETDIRLLLIYSNKFTPPARKLQSQIGTSELEVIYYKYFQFNKMDYCLVPKHEIITDPEELKEIDPQCWPTILINLDPIAIYLDIQAGCVVGIDRRVFKIKNGKAHCVGTVRDYRVGRPSCPKTREKTKKVTKSISRT